MHYSITFLLFFLFFHFSLTPTTTTPTTTLDPDPDDPDPVYTIPQHAKSCPPGLDKQALIRFNSMRKFLGLPPLNYDPGLTSALAQDFSNHHLSNSSFHNASFAGYGYTGLTFWYMPPPPDDQPLHIHLKIELSALSEEILISNPWSMGHWKQRVTNEEWAATRVFGLGCTAWPSDWSGDDLGRGSGNKEFIIAPKAYDTFNGKEISKDTLRSRLASAPLESWIQGVNLVLVAFFRSPSVPTTTTTTTTPTTTTTTTPTTTTTTTTPTTTTTTTPTTTTTTTPTTTTTSTTTTTTTPSTTTVSTTPLPGSFLFPVPNTKECPQGFVDYLVGEWNEERMKDNMRKLIIEKKAMIFGQEAAKNMSEGGQIIYNDFSTGVLNFTATISKPENVIYGNAIQMVKLKNGQMPITGDGPFSNSDWVESNSFGVGCAAFINSENHTELLIAMIFLKKIN